MPLPTRHIEVQETLGELFSSTLSTLVSIAPWLLVNFLVIKSSRMRLICSIDFNLDTQSLGHNQQSNFHKSSVSTLEFQVVFSLIFYITFFTGRCIKAQDTTGYTSDCKNSAFACKEAI